MRLNRQWARSFVLAGCGASVAWLITSVGQVSWGQQELTEPVFHVAREGGAQQAKPASLPQAAPIAAAAKPFDLTQQPGEHPLTPVIRVWKEVLAHIDSNVRDYSCSFEKRERLEGRLGEKQIISMKVRHQPFSVYMFFHQPYQGREVLYIDGQNNNELTVLEAGFKRRLGPMNLDPNGWLAMRGQKYPITKVGIRNLMAEAIAYAEADTKFGECDVKTDLNTNIDGRPTTLVQIQHPVPRREFRAYITRIFLDNELRVPIHYDAYMWPEAQGQSPPLEESYTYRNMKLNVGLTADDFDPKNPAIFK